MELTTFPTTVQLVFPTELIAEVQAGGRELDHIVQRMVQAEQTRHREHITRSLRMRGEDWQPDFVPKEPREIVDEAKAELAGRLAARGTPEGRMFTGTVEAQSALAEINALLEQVRSAKSRGFAGNRDNIIMWLTEAEALAIDVSAGLQDALKAASE